METATNVRVFRMQYKQSLVRSVLIIMASMLTACGGMVWSEKPINTASYNPDQRPARWLTDGSIAIAAPIPKISTPDLGTVFGFLPRQLVEERSWALIDTSRGELTLMKGSEAVSSFFLDEAEFLNPGSYQVMHKQHDPLWYAPDSYFEKRGLIVPAKATADRYLRGALGKSAIFLDADTPIHNGLIWSEEVGGARVEAERMVELFDSVELGDLVKVQ